MERTEMSREQPADMLRNERFPRSANYDPEWIVANSMGPHPLWLTEWLCEEIDLAPGMRVLDMGCGKAISSIFLAREYNVQVWATDLWVSPPDNWRRIRDAGLEKQVHPIHAEAHALPYPEGFFDAIVSVNSYMYYGTDDLYLNYFVKFAKPRAPIGVVVTGWQTEPHGPIPPHLAHKENGHVFWEDECLTYHTLQWWRNHWHRTGEVDVLTADTLEDGWRVWLQHEKAVEMTREDYTSDVNILEADQGKYLAIMRLIAKRKPADTPSA